MEFPLHLKIFRKCDPHARHTLHVGRRAHVLGAHLQHVQNLGEFPMLMLNADVRLPAVLSCVRRGKESRGGWILVRCCKPPMRDGLALLCAPRGHADEPAGTMLDPENFKKLLEWKACRI